MGVPVCCGMYGWDGAMCVTHRAAAKPAGGPLKAGGTMGYTLSRNGSRGINIVAALYRTRRATGHSAAVKSVLLKRTPLVYDSASRLK
jgi:hypothetical protein